MIGTDHSAAATSASLSFSRADAQIMVPDDAPVLDALRRTTHLGIGAHADDLETLAIEGILLCAKRSDRWFTGVVVTDGSGSVRSGRFADFSDQQIRQLRGVEQQRAAELGGYSAVVQLGHPSASAKAGDDSRVVEDLVRVLSWTEPEVVYTHDLADPHPTHVAVTLRVVEALRRLPKENRPRRLIGCEVWRGLDWLTPSERVVMRLESDESVQFELLRVFETQIASGKRYDRAVLGRRSAHATFAESHAVDGSSLIALGMDLTPLIDGKDPAEHVQDRIDRFAEEVRGRIRKLSGPGSGDIP